MHLTPPPSIHVRGENGGPCMKKVINSEHVILRIENHVCSKAESEFLKINYSRDLGARRLLQLPFMTNMISCGFVTSRKAVWRARLRLPKTINAHKGLSSFNEQYVNCKICCINHFKEPLSNELNVQNG